MAYQTLKQKRQAKWQDFCKSQQNKEKEDMSKQDYDFGGASAAQVKGNAVDAITTAKDVIIEIQKGQAVVTAIKAALGRTPGCPDTLKVLLSSPYGDLIVGLLLHTTAPVLTGSPTILKAVKAANVAGAVSVSQQFTFIQDAIESAINSIPGFEEITDKASGVMTDENNGSKS